MELITCNVCNQEQPETCFEIRKESLKRRKDCKECRSKHHKAYYLNNKEAAYLRSKKWISSDVGKLSLRNQHLKKSYGLTLQDYEDILVEQAGKCLICNVHYLELTKPLCVDHCHTTGKVRGLLCNFCNLALGYMQDSPVRLASAISYLERTNS